MKLKIGMQVVKDGNKKSFIEVVEVGENIIKGFQTYIRKDKKAGKSKKIYVKDEEPKIWLISFHKWESYTPDNSSQGAKCATASPALKMRCLPACCISNF